MGADRLIASTTVNAITIRTGFDVSSGAAKGTTFAILPKPSPAGAGANEQSVSPLSDAASKRIPLRRHIFGDKWSPYLGNPVYVVTPAGLKQIPMGYAPKRDETLVIPVLQPKKRRSPSSSKTTMADSSARWTGMGMRRLSGRCSRRSAASGG